MSARLLVALALLLVAGCGRVGPLTLPDDAPPPVFETDVTIEEDDL